VKLVRAQAASPRVPRGERGGVLAGFAMFSFVGIGFLALSFDCAVWWSTQHEMQCAVDPAAVEGSRLRDHEEYQPLSNALRRSKNSDFVREYFDDDLDPANGDLVRLSAGPDHRVDGGAGSMNTGAVVDLEGPRPCDDPQLPYNEANDARGNQRSGTYLPSQRFVPGASGATPDFAPATGVDAFQSLCYEIRLSRDGAEDIEGVASSLPTVPWLFALGTLVRGAAGERDPRRDGTRIRAHAVAGGVPALRVGKPPRTPQGTPVRDESSNENNHMLGDLGFGLDSQYYLQLVSAAGSAQLSVAADGSLSQAGVVRGAFLQHDGHVGARAVGAAPIPFTERRGYIPVYEQVAGPSGQVRRVVLWIFVECEYAANNGSPQIRSLRLGFPTNHDTVHAWVAPHNASANFGGLELGLAKSELDAVMRRNHELAYTTGARTYDRSGVRKGVLLATALLR
jgi:hypothetical protein